MRPSLPRTGWWRRLVQVAVATSILGIYFTFVGRLTLAFASYAIGLIAAGCAAWLLRRGI
jgi:hypothetical protein